MNPKFDPTPREVQEAKLTALLLGELSVEEAVDVRQAMANDAELAKLHQRLEATAQLVRAATADSDMRAAGVAGPLQLSDDKRAGLLQAFKTVRPEFRAPRRGRVRWQLQMGLAAALVALIGVVALLPSVQKAKTQSQRVASASRSAAKAKLNRPSPSKAWQDFDGPLDLKTEALFQRTPTLPATEPASVPTGPVAQAERFYDKITTAGGDGLSSRYSYGAGMGGGAGLGAAAPQAKADRLPVIEDVPTAGKLFGSQLNSADDASAPVQLGFEAASKPLGTLPSEAPSQQPLIAGQAGQTRTDPNLLTPDGARRGVFATEPETLTKAAKELTDRERRDQDRAGKPVQEAREERLRMLIEQQEELKLGLAARDLPSLKLEVAGEKDFAKQAAPKAAVPQPEVQTRENAISTFSLNVTDVSFRLTAASLEKGLLPESSTIRSEEFINAFDYRDPEPSGEQAVSFAWERARYPFAQDRDVLRLSIKTAGGGRAAGRPLNLVLLLDRSGSMERADRVRIVQEALRVLSHQLGARDTVSVVVFARTARLVADGANGTNAPAALEEAANVPPEGGTNLEEALGLAYRTAMRRHSAATSSRVVMLTDGAANLGNVDAEALRRLVQTHRQQGVALDCFGVGWEGYNDELLQALSSTGDGRYGFINTPEEAKASFAGQLAGAFQVAAADVKVQVEFNPKRVSVYRQVGYAKHQLAAEQFRDNRVDAAEIGSAEAGVAIYVVQVNQRGEGDLAQVRVRYKSPGTNSYHEQQWTVPFLSEPAPLENAAPALRLAATAGAFSEWLASSPFAAEVTPDHLLRLLAGVPEAFGGDVRVRQLESMIRQAKSLR